MKSSAKCIALAQNTTGLHLIMGGHSHTPLGTGENEEGPYPTIIKDKLVARSKDSSTLTIHSPGLKTKFELVPDGAIGRKCF